MKVIIAPAKTQNFKLSRTDLPAAAPVFEKEAEELVDLLKGYSAEELESVLKINPALAAKTYQQYQNFNSPDNPRKQAVLTYNGLVFGALDAENLPLQVLRYAQDHLRILSGLYGILHPFDMIQPYRLDVGDKLETKSGDSLYQFWEDRVTDRLLHDGVGKALVNLASDEYVRMIDLNRLPVGVPVITPVFKELRDGKYKVIVTATKQARGRMARYILENRLTEPEDLKEFHEEGYTFFPDLSSESEWVFVR